MDGYMHFNHIPSLNSLAVLSSDPCSFWSIMRKIILLLFPSIFLVLMITITITITIPTEASNVTAPAVLAFGDSIIDPGNNNNLQTLIKCNFPPYGKDFMGGLPTGRFSNGKIPTDFLAEALSIKEYVPAYLDPNLKAEDLMTGVSFASGACGYDTLTSKLSSVIPLSQQLEYFKEYIGKLRNMVGEDRSHYIISKSVYLIVAGSDDIANTYFDTPFRRHQYDVHSYTDLMLSSASQFLQELYKLGARKIAIFGAPPIGCVPSQRTIGGGILRDCADDYNNVAKLFNSKLIAQVHSLSSKFANAKVIYIDAYNPIYDIIQNPHKYGFEETTRGCCGTGIIEVTLLCNKFDPVCPDDTKYFFWDSYHPTERGYKILFDEMKDMFMNLASS